MYRKQKPEPVDVDNALHALAKKRSTTAGKIEKEQYEAYSNGVKDWKCSCGKLVLACEELFCGESDCPVRKSLDRIA